jgi:nucleoside 2-deoxyribosyltransferase
MNNKESYFTGIECKFERDDCNRADCFWDPVCGIYSITDDVALKLTDKKIKWKIANVLAQKNCRGINVPIRITSNDQGKDGNWHLEPVHNLLSQYPLSPLEIFDEILINISYLVMHPSENISITKDESWYFYSHDISSCLNLLRKLENLGYIQFHSTGMTSATISIEINGWRKLSELKKSSGTDRKQAFVAMWFDKTMDSFYQNGIKQAIEADGTKCIRIDLQEHNNKICDEIIAEIRKSNYLVADFTGNRGGVYYEAGFAYGLGIPVIWTIHQDHLANVHFDTRQYNHIVYETEEELKERFLSRIQATIVD